MRPLTCSYFLLLVLGRLFLHALPLLLGIRLPSLWSTLFPLHAPALIPLSRAKVRPSLTWTLSHLTIWCFGLMALFLLARWLWRTCQLLSLWHRGHSFLFSRPSMLKIFRWSLRHSESSLLVSAAPTSLPLLFSSCQTPVLSSPPCPLLRLFFYLNLCDRSGRNCLPCSLVLSGYNGSPSTRFSRGMTRLMSWPDGQRYSCPLQSLVVLFSYLSYLLLFFLGLEVYCLI